MNFVRAVHLISRFRLILLILAKFSCGRDARVFAGFPNNRTRSTMRENSSGCRHDDGSTVKRRHYYWSAGGITLRLSFISRRSLAFAASSYFSPSRDETPAGWLRSARSLLWHRSRITLHWEIDFSALSLSLSLSLSLPPLFLSVSISLSVSAFTSISLSLCLSLHNLGQAGTLSLPLGVDYLDKDLFSAEYSMRDECLILSASKHFLTI